VVIVGDVYAELAGFVHEGGQVRHDGVCVGHPVVPAEQKLSALGQGF
jgi:hypothetical protein